MLVAATATLIAWGPCDKPEPRRWRKEGIPPENKTIEKVKTNIAIPEQLFHCCRGKKKIACFLLEQHPNALSFTEINGEHYKSPLTLQAGAGLSAFWYPLEPSNSVSTALLKPGWHERGPVAETVQAPPDVPAAQLQRCLVHEERRGRAPLRASREEAGLQGRMGMGQRRVMDLKCYICGYQENRVHLFFLSHPGQIGA